MNRINSTISSRWVVITIIAISLAIRIIYFTSISSTPCYEQHLWDQTDMSFFDLWGRDISQGDWLTNKPLHPSHVWYEWVADIHFQAHPEQLPAFQDSDSSNISLSAKRNLWDHWYGGKRYHNHNVWVEKEKIA